MFGMMTSTRQTPRPKKIDVGHQQRRRSSMYSSPSSDCAPSWRSGPPSPALSSAGSLTSTLSWFAEKSPAELIPLLKEAYGALRDKERDLLLAAEIGKSLLDNNIALKSKYEALLQQLQAYQEQQQQQRYMVTLSTPQQQPYPPSPHNNESTAELNVISDNDIKSDGDATESADGDPDFRRPRRLAQSYKTDAAVETLQEENQELQQKLETATSDLKAAEKSHKQKMRRMESEVQSLRSELESATKKVTELEETNDKLVLRQRKNQQSNQDESSMLYSSAPAVLYEKLQIVEQENVEITQAKEDLEEKLAATVSDLNMLKDKFDQFQFTQTDYIALQEAYQRQLKHISELNQSLEEHRNLLQSVNDKNNMSARNSPAPSESGDSAWSAYGGGKGSDSAGMRRRMKHSLLSELEKEFSKDLKTPSKMGPISETDEIVESSHSSAASEMGTAAAHAAQAQVMLTEKSLAAMYLSPAEQALESLLNKAGMQTQISIQPVTNMMMDDLYDEYDDMYDDMGSSNMSDIDEEDSESALVISRNEEAQRKVGFIGKIARIFGAIFRLIRRIIMYILKWVRFFWVLWAAFLINLFLGPDRMLKKEKEAR
ncbi:hypothetical protein BC938DRAFT_475089 [Jimgerdemannia flammicorona]|uniref:Uncharacterized protein n=1 Tax=Jimgerdemannia flammicorona TaxID=994334 RepID=A0A433Q133_9FUNG|nr:hypothetical protein BC938DRAFT_475089 [Jimgerdemannia flammicorona]